MISILSMAVLALLVTSVAQAANDGDMKPQGVSSDGSYIKAHEDLPFWRGQITHDMSSPRTNPFLGSYDGSSYDLASEFGLETWDYDEFYDNNGANLTANPAEVNYNQWNTSGLIRMATSTTEDGAWSESDASSLLTSSITKTGGKQKASDSLHLVFGSSSGASSAANYNTNFASEISENKYFVFGAYINSETINFTSSYSVYFELYEQRSQSGDALRVVLKEGATDWATVTSSTNHMVTFDDDQGDVIFFVKKISEWDDLTTNVDLTGINSAKINFNPQGSGFEGIISVDIFAFDFLDSIPRFGEDEGDLLTSSDDYVSFNVTDPSSADKTVLASKINSNVASIEDGTIDFVSFLETSNVITNDDSYRIEYQYDPFIDEADDLIVANAVTWSSLTIRMMMGGDENDYLSIRWEGTQQKTLVIDEEPGDFITIASSLAEDTTYTLNIIIQYSAFEYNFVLNGNSQDNSSLVQKAILWVLGGVAAVAAAMKLGGVSNSINTFSNKNVRSKSVTKKNFQPRRRR